MTSGTDEVCGQSSVKFVDSYGHLEIVKGIGHDIVGVDVVASAGDLVCVGLLGTGEEQKLCAGRGLEAGQAKVR